MRDRSPRDGLRAPRNAQIDGLRGVAILAVLLLHFTLTYRLGESPLGRILPVGWIRALFLNGNYGVTLFFVVSGYLITGLSLDRFGSLGQIRLGTFYRLRAARILPGLLLTLLVILALGLAGRPSFMNAGQGGVLPHSRFVLAMFSLLTCWHNVLMAHWGYFNFALNIFWSLSVEEVFYLLFPLATRLLGRLPILGLALVLLGVGPWFRARHLEDEIQFLYGYLACFDAIALGCLTALAARRVTLSFRAALGINLVGLLLVGITWLQGIDGHEVWGFSRIALGGALLVWGSRAPLLGWRPLAWLGWHSYELYLVHIVVLGLMRDWMGRNRMPWAWKLPWLLLYLGGAVLGAWGLARHWTGPLNRRLRGACGRP